MWLDGAYLGDPEGYFFPHSFDVTALSRLGEDHVIAVEVTCNPERGTTGRRNITGLFQHSEAVDRRWNPGGLWRPVLVYDTGPVKLDRLRVLCRDADDTRAHLRLSARLESEIAQLVSVRTTADGTVVGETEHPLAAGTNEIEWSLDIDRPRLWWPRALGDQPLTEIGVELLVAGEVSDRRSRRTGLREVAWTDWVCSVNGERLFLKAANVLPTRPGLADASPADVRRDVELAVEAGLDALRVKAHVAHPELYQAADELGVLLLQDFPLQWGYARQIRREAVRQAREAVNALGHHPSIVQWCAHDEPIADAPQVEADSRSRRLRRFVSQQLPTWNKTVLDRWIKRAFEQADPTRPTVAHGGVIPHLPQLDGTDTHLWLGWHRGEIGELADVARVVPRVVRFVSEFGAQSVPDSAESFVDVTAWPELDWEALREHHGLEVEVMDARVPPADHPTFGSWRTATQRNQAMVLRHHIETLRRLKYRPTGGFSFSWLADPAPDDLGVRARPRAGAQAGVADRGRRLPADRRDHRPAAGRPRAGPGDRARRARRQRPARRGGRRHRVGDVHVARRPAGLGVPRRCRRRLGRPGRPPRPRRARSSRRAAARCRPHGSRRRRSGGHGDAPRRRPHRRARERLRRRDRLRRFLTFALR